MILFACLMSFAVEPIHMTVDEALKALNADNPSIARAVAAGDGARAGRTIATAGVLPSVSVAGGFTRYDAEVSFDLAPLFEALGGTPPDPVVLQPLSAFTANATLRVPLVAPQAWAGIAAANHMIRSADALEQGTRTALQGTAVQGFWTAAAAEGLITAFEASVERSNTLLATAKRAEAAGATTRLPILQAEAELARRQGDLLAARASLEKTRSAIGALLGVDGPVAVDSPSNQENQLDEDTLVASALSSRPELIAAREQVEAARARLTGVRAGLAPTVAASATGLASSSAFSTGEKTAWRVGLDLTWVPLAGGLRAGNTEQASAALADAEAAETATRLQISRQVRDAVADVAVAAQRVEASTRQHAAAAEAATMSQRSYDQGTLDAASVIDSLERLDQAEASRVDTHARLGMAHSALRTAIGE